MHSPKLFEPVLLLGNHLLRQNPDVRQRLSGFNGLVCAVRGNGWQVSAQIGADGLLQAATRRADTVLVLHAGALAALPEGRLPQAGDWALEGDAELGMHLLWCFAALRYRPLHDLTALLGSDKAERWAQHLAQWGGCLKWLAAQLDKRTTAS